MYRIDNTDAVSALPPPAPLGQPGYFTGGNPQAGQAATIVDADWLNALQEEIATVIERAALTLSKTDRTQLWQALQSMSRITLTAPLDLYVSPTGNDANDGLTVGTPMLTMLAAYNKACTRYSLNSYYVTIHLADGNYPATMFEGPTLGPWDPTGTPVRIVGNSTNPQNVNVTSTSGGSALGTLSGAYILFDGMTVSSVGGVNGAGIGASLGGISAFRNIHFGNCAVAQLYSGLGGQISAFGNYSIVGGAQAHALSDYGAILLEGYAATLTGTPNFSGGFASAEHGGLVAALSMTFTGAATGPRFYVTTNAVVDTASGNANYFPGNAVGVQNTGGQYV